MTNRPRLAPALDELSLIARAFAPQLLDGDLHDVLAYLNGLTDHRFTGVYRFEPGWVVSVALFDRENPGLRIGDDVKMQESYCWLTGLGDTSYVIEDACLDTRLVGHAAREAVRAYVAVLLRDKRRTPWGTLCHFDFQPRAASPETLERLAISGRWSRSSSCATSPPTGTPRRRLWVDASGSARRPKRASSRLPSCDARPPTSDGGSTTAPCACWSPENLFVRCPCERSHARPVGHPSRYSPAPAADPDTHCRGAAQWPLDNDAGSTSGASFRRRPPVSAFLVADDTRGALVGFASFWAIPSDTRAAPTIRIVALVVARDARRRRIAERQRDGQG